MGINNPTNVDHRATTGRGHFSSCATWVYDFHDSYGGFPSHRGTPSHHPFRTMGYSITSSTAQGVTESLEKRSESRLSYLFGHLQLLSSHSFSSLLTSWFVLSDSSHLCFSICHIVRSLTSKLREFGGRNLHRQPFWGEIRRHVWVVYCWGYHNPSRGSPVVEGSDSD